MAHSIVQTIYEREIAARDAARSTLRRLYGARGFVHDLDIVNELHGHSGCVNALSWSKSGSLLASGSDDQHLNIYNYHPTAVDSQFQLATTVATGHTRNIFSVKFMPHSGDRTVITAAGDGEVRVFDLEYAGQARETSRAASSAATGRRRGRNSMFDGVKYMSDGDTNCRVYRSHSDAVKRIVTESSPYLFLTCSEDGEVRQWDLRLPSEAYPPSSSRRSGGDSTGPPPLISYKRYCIDLNTISCSASQPHYIALGGAHMHCFLHDRRKSGRDLLAEAGVPISRPKDLSEEDQERLAQATQCVRKFAPKGQRRMRAADNGHITACKISDARPDEMVVSWSGDHIYSFDLLRDPPPRSKNMRSPEKRSIGGGDVERKRKRRQGSDTSVSQAATERQPVSRPRTAESIEEEDEDADTALRIRYQNGQTEDIPIATPPMTESQRDAQRVAKATVKIRSALFGKTDEGGDPTAQFTSALGSCAAILADIDETIRTWRYPVEPTPEQIYVQKTLRRQREATRRFVQTAGTIARVLGGKLQTPTGSSPLMAHFINVEVSNTHLELSQKERFAYDFIKAILLWVDSGIGNLIDGFTRPADMRTGSKAASRLPIPEADASTEAIDDYLVPYLLALADDGPIEDVTANAFETDEHRRLYTNKRAAVINFARATRTPFADLSSAVVEAEGGAEFPTQDRKAAVDLWANKLARGLLLDVAEGLSSAIVDRAFGGLGRPVPEEVSLTMMSEGADDLLDMHHARTVLNHPDEDASDTDGSAADSDHDEVMDDGEEDEEDDSSNDEDGYDNDDDDDEPNDFDDDDDEMNDSSDDEEDGVPNIGVPGYIYQSAYQRRRLKPTVEAHVPCSGPVRTYKGHCNVRTVKDVNYFGLDDEYVVSGSDDGNFFIWDRKTGQIVNILEGDGEVVNVIQGHPYEPMLAVSGIDYTVKIFSPDARARQQARLNPGMSAQEREAVSQLSWPLRRAAFPIGVRRTRTADESVDDESPTDRADQGPSGEEAEDEEYVAPNGLRSRKRLQDRARIVQNNDREREGGNQEAVITRDMLAQLAERIRLHRAVTGQTPATADGDDVRLVLNENCGVQ